MRFAKSIVPVLGPEIGASILYDDGVLTLCIYAWRHLVLLSVYWGEEAK